MKRIGVFVCHCGINIATSVDVDKVVEEIRHYPGVAHAVNYQYMCSDPGQKMVQEAIEREKLDGVIVAACSPTTLSTSTVVAMLMPQWQTKTPILFIGSPTGKSFYNKDLDIKTVSSAPIDSDQFLFLQQREGIDEMPLKSQGLRIQAESQGKKLREEKDRHGLKAGKMLTEFLLFLFQVIETHGAAEHDGVGPTFSGRLQDIVGKPAGSLR